MFSFTLCVNVVELYEILVILIIHSYLLAHLLMYLFTGRTDKIMISQETDLLIRDVLEGAFKKNSPLNVFIALHVAGAINKTSIITMITKILISL